MQSLAPAESALAFQWFFGAAVVVVYAMDRFKNPSPMRATTTFWRYWTAWSGYLVAMLALFVFLGGGFTVVDVGMLTAVLGGDIDGASTDATQLPGPLLAALVLTSLLPHFPVLGKLDTAVKEWFQRVGNMPFEVRELSARLAEASYAPSAEAVPVLQPVFEELHVDPAWLAAPAGTIKHRWACCAALYAQIRRWEGARGYSRFVQEHKGAFADIRTRVNTLAEVLDEFTLNELDRDSESRLVAHMRKNIKKDIAGIRQALCDFVSAGVLDSGWNHGQRCAAVTRLGFGGLSAVRGPLSAHDLVLVVGLVFLALLFIPLMMRRFVNPEPLGMNVRLLIMVPIIYAVAIVSAIYPKSVLPFASRQAGGRRPVGFYALSGAIAAVAAFVVSLLFRFAFDSAGNVFQALASPDAFVTAWKTSTQRWPWLLMTFLMTVAIAWAADDQPAPGARAAQQLRWTETAALAGIFAAAQWAVLQLMMTLPALAHRADTLRAAQPRMLITAIVIGALIGWFVPHLYRTQGSGLGKPELEPAALV